MSEHQGTPLEALTHHKEMRSGKRLHDTLEAGRLNGGNEYRKSEFPF